jgi:hypothetical protein
MSNDRFWKVIAIIGICALFANAYVYFRLNRYQNHSKGFVLDKWTGRVYHISQLYKKSK